MSEDRKLPLRRMDTPLAREVAELLLVKVDLERCIEGFKLWVGIQSDDEKKQAHLASALFRDSVLTFTACFDTSLPPFLSADTVYQDVDGGAAYFKWLLDMRDTWIAHRLGPSRFASFGFFIDPDSGDVIGDGVFHGAYAYPSQEIAADLIAFTRIAVEYVERILSEKTAELRSDVNALFPNQRLKLPNARFVPPSPDHLRMGRRKYENVRPKPKP